MWFSIHYIYIDGAGEGGWRSKSDLMMQPGASLHELTPFNKYQLTQWKMYKLIFTSSPGYLTHFTEWVIHFSVLCYDNNIFT